MVTAILTRVLLGSDASLESSFGRSKIKHSDNSCEGQPHLFLRCKSPLRDLPVPWRSLLVPFGPPQRGRRKGPTKTDVLYKLAFFWCCERREKRGKKRKKRKKERKREGGERRK